MTDGSSKPLKTPEAPQAMEEDNLAEEDQDPKAIPDMSEAQNIFLVELATTNPEAVPDLAQVKAHLLTKVRDLT